VQIVFEVLWRDCENQAACVDQPTSVLLVMVWGVAYHIRDMMRDCRARIR